MANPQHASRADAQRAGWFSRRHQTAEGHKAARAARDEKTAARRLREAAQAAATDERRKQALQEKLSLRSQLNRLLGGA